MVGYGSPQPITNLADKKLLISGLQVKPNVAVLRQGCNMASYMRTAIT